MIPTGASERLRAAFAAQFEPDGTGYLYRKDRAGPAIRVSADEQAEFIAAYRRATRIFQWTTVPGMVLAAVVSTLLWPGVTRMEWPIYVEAGVFLLAFVAIQFWIKAAPARALQYRMPSRPAISKDERRRASMQRLSYRRLALLGLIAPVLVWNAARMGDILHGWGRLWIVGAAAVTILCGVQAFRKRRFDASER